MDTQESSTQTQGAELQKGVSVRAVVISIVTVVVMGMIGLYLWGSTLTPQDLQKPVTEERTLQNNEPETPRMDADVQALNTVSPSDEVSAITADIESTNLDSIETDLQGIGAEIGTFVSQTSNVQ